MTALHNYMPFPDRDRTRPKFFEPENIRPGDQLRLISDDPAADGHTGVFLVLGAYEDGEDLTVRTTREKPVRAIWSQSEGGWRIEWQGGGNCRKADGVLRSLETCECIRLSSSSTLRWLDRQYRLKPGDEGYVDLYAYYHGG